MVVKMIQLNITQRKSNNGVLRKDRNGIWGCAGKLRRTMPQNEDFPYFIGKGKVAELIVKHYQEKSFHTSVHYIETFLLNQLLELWQCDRLKRVGVDLYGPTIIKENHANIKR
ncbi:hypothetical protein DINM_006919 [Dirofilaria immitis]|nr:hypothetical protein [Dirofilaria immitis]